MDDGTVNSRQLTLQAMKVKTTFDTRDQIMHIGTITISFS